MARQPRRTGHHGTRRFHERPAGRGIRRHGDARTPRPDLLPDGTCRLRGRVVIEPCRYFRLFSSCQPGKFPEPGCPPRFLDADDAGWAWKYDESADHGEESWQASSGRPVVWNEDDVSLQTAAGLAIMIVSQAATLGRIEP